MLIEGQDFPLRMANKRLSEGIANELCFLLYLNENNFVGYSDNISSIFHIRQRETINTIF